MPSIGFIARFAMPVLKDMEVMSRIAVPVVSDPVPAVVGTVSLPSVERQHITRYVRTCNKRTQLFCDRKALAYRRVNEVEQVCVLVHREPTVHEVQ